MKTFESFGNDDYNDIEDKIKKEFLELSHLDELEIKFDFIDYRNYIFYFYKDISLFHKDKKNSILGIVNFIWNRFYDFDITFNEINGYLHNIICNNYFNTHDDYLLYEFTTKLFNNNFIR